MRELGLFSPRAPGINDDGKLTQANLLLNLLDQFKPGHVPAPNQALRNQSVRPSAANAAAQCRQQSYRRADQLYNAVAFNLVIFHHQQVLYPALDKPFDVSSALANASLVTGFCRYAIAPVADCAVALTRQII